MSSIPTLSSSSLTIAIACKGLIELNKSISANVAFSKLFYEYLFLESLELLKILSKSNKMIGWLKLIVSWLGGKETTECQINCFSINHFYKTVDNIRS